MRVYEGSPLKILSTVFPECQWPVWKFDRVTVKAFRASTKQDGALSSDSSNVVTYVQWLEQQLGIKEEKDWEDITHAELTRHIGAKGLRYERAVKQLKRKYAGSYWAKSVFASQASWSCFSMSTFLF